jgi:hypothetical protein
VCIGLGYVIPICAPYLIRLMVRGGKDGGEKTERCSMPLAIDRTRAVYTFGQATCNVRAASLVLLSLAHEPRLVDACGRHVLELGHPCSDVLAIGVIVLGAARNESTCVDILSIRVTGLGMAWTQGQAVRGFGEGKEAKVGLTHMD